MTAAGGVQPVLLDAEHPWPALSSFDEAGQPFFNGRTEEIAALHRLVRQGRLTVLFGRSGLGKTSLLRAGLFPVLRPDRLLPVSIRLTFDDDGAPLVAQLARRLQEEIALHGIDAPPMSDGEDLWRYLHRSGLEMWSRQNHLVTPVFVLDQFEEVFTLGARHPEAVKRLVTDLADLVENRLPSDLLRDDEDLAGLSVERQPYKVLLSFREDFLAAFEGWKKSMPSLLHNRYRLLPMTGTRAFEAIRDSAPHLVDEVTASAIVRFVTRTSLDDQRAGTSADEVPLADLSVEPALLSLLCHGLNERRLAAGKRSIDAELLAGAGGSILEDFYQSSLRDTAVNVSQFIEEELITEGGFRKACAIDDARKYDVPAEQLSLLVDRRLLRVEPYQGIDRVELIHDILTRIVRQRRDARRAMAKEAESERRARQKRRAFVLSAAMAGTAIVLLVVAGLALVARRQARSAEEQRRIAEQASKVARAAHIAAVGDSKLDREPELALVLALESLNTARTSQGESLLRHAVSRIPSATLPAALRGTVAVTADGTSAIVAPNNVVTIHGLESPVNFTLPHEATPMTLAFSPDGQRLAVVTQDEFVVLWDVRSRTRLRRDRIRLAPDSPGPRAALDITHMAFNGTGDVVALAGAWGPTGLWDPNTGSFTPLARHRETGFLQSVSDGVIAMWFTTGGSLAAVLSSGSVATWDVKKPTALPSSKAIPVKGSILAAAVSPTDHNLVAVATYGATNISPPGPGKAYLVTLGETDSVRELIPASAATTNAMAFDPTGTFLWTGTEYGDVNVWQTSGAQLIRTFRAHSDAVRALAASGNGRWFISAGDDLSARVWPAHLLPVTSLPGLRDMATALAIDPKGTWVAGADMSGALTVWDGANKLRWSTKHKDAITALAASRDGTLLVSAGGKVLSGGGRPGGDTAIRFWDAATGKLVREIAENRDDVIGAAFSVDSRFLLTAGVAPGVRIWDVSSGKLVRTLTADDAESSMQVGLSGDGRVVAAQGKSAVLLWQFDSGALIRKIPLGIKGSASAFALDEKGQLVLVTSFSAPNAEVYDTASGALLQRIRVGSGANSADVSSDSLLAVITNISGPPIMVDLTTGRTVASLAPAQGAWQALFTVDSRRIAVASSTGGILLFDCGFCGPIADVQRLAETRVTRKLSDQERRGLLRDLRGASDEPAARGGQ